MLSLRQLRGPSFELHSYGATEVSVTLKPSFESYIE
jgi:hypothetical protein